MNHPENKLLTDAIHVKWDLVARLSMVALLLFYFILFLSMDS